MLPNRPDTLNILPAFKNTDLRNDKMSLAAVIACDLYVAVPLSLLTSPHTINNFRNLP